MVDPITMPFGSILTVGKWVYDWMQKRKERDKEGVVVYMDTLKDGNDRFVYRNGEFVHGDKGPRKGAYESSPGNLVFEKEYDTEEGTIRFTFDTFYEPVESKEYPAGLRKKKSLTKEELAEFTKERLEYVDKELLFGADEDQRKDYLANKVRTAYEYFGLGLVESGAEDSIGFTYQMETVEKPKKKVDWKKTHKKFREDAAEDMGKKILPEISGKIEGAKEETKKEIREGMKELGQSVEKRVDEAEKSAYEADAELEHRMAERSDRAYATKAEAEGAAVDAAHYADVRDEIIWDAIQDRDKALGDNMEELCQEIEGNFFTKEEAEKLRVDADNHAEGVYQELKDYTDKKDEIILKCVEGVCDTIGKNVYAKDEVDKKVEGVKEYADRKESELREDFDSVCETIDEHVYTKDEVDARVENARKESQEKYDELASAFELFIKDIGQYGIGALCRNVERLESQYASEAISRPVPKGPELTETAGLIDGRCLDAADCAVPEPESEQPAIYLAPDSKAFEEAVIKASSDPELSESLREKARRMVAEQEAAKIVRENPVYYVEGKAKRMRKAWAHVLYKGLEKAGADSYDSMKIYDVFTDDEIRSLLKEAEREDDISPFGEEKRR